MPTITIHGIPGSYTGSHHSTRTLEKIAEAISKELVGIDLPRGFNVSILLDTANQGEPSQEIIIAIDILPEDSELVSFWEDISSKCQNVMREFFKITPIRCIVRFTTSIVVSREVCRNEPYMGTIPCPQCRVLLKKSGSSWDCPNCGYIHLSPP